MKKLLMLSYVLILVMTMYGSTVFAHEYKAVDVDIGVRVKNGGTVSMTAEVNSPLPKETKINIANGKKDAFHISFNQVGEYTYTIETVKKNKKVNYDSTVYRVKCYVFDDNGKLKVTTVIYNLKTGKKYSPDNKENNVLVEFSNSKKHLDKEKESKNKERPIKKIRNIDNQKKISDSRPKTGDDSQLDLYLILCILTSFGLFILSISYYRYTTHIVSL